MFTAKTYFSFMTLSNFTIVHRSLRFCSSKVIYPPKSNQAVHPRHWNEMIKQHRVNRNVQEAMRVYESMISNGTRLNKYTLDNLLSVCLDVEPELSMVLWRDIVDDYTESEIKRIFDHRSVHTLFLCIERLSEGDTHEDARWFLNEVWNSLMVNHRIQCNLTSYCLVIFLFSKYPQCNLSLELLNDLENNDEIIDSLRQKDHSQSFELILMSYSNLNLLDELWTFYQRIYSMDYHFALFLSVFSRMKIDDKLYVMRHCLDFDGMDDVNALKYFHRISVEGGDLMIKRKLKKLMDSKGFLERNVSAEFRMNGNTYRLQTGYEMDEFQSMRKVQRLMKSIEYKTDPLCAVEMKGTEARETHLKSHAEKKALAVLIENCKELQFDPLVISVSMRMCVDCIEFFRKTSQYFACEIHCTDPKCTHIFVNGEHFKR